MTAADQLRPGGASVRAVVSRGARAARRFRPRDWHAITFWGGILLAGAASGLFYGLVAARARPLVGAGYGACIAGAVMLFERGVVAQPLRDRLRRLPWAIGVVLTEFVYLGLVLVGSAVAGSAFWATGVMTETLARATLPDIATLFYSLVVCGVVITMMRMRDLIGADVFRNVVLGRYYRPVEEERVFLFIDLVGSTAYAQTHGDLRTQAFLGAIFEALAEPVRRHRGSVDDYVGDMALVTWRLEVGAREGRCLRCVFDFLHQIEADAERWQHRFGQVPRFRAALHGGGVVTAEVGGDRHKIAYFGDVVNTTARLETLCRTLGAELLISADLLERLSTLPEGIQARPLGAHAVNGRGGLVTVMALEQASRRQAAAA